MSGNFTFGNSFSTTWPCSEQTPRRLRVSLTIIAIDSYLLGRFSTAPRGGPAEAGERQREARDAPEDDHAEVAPRRSARPGQEPPSERGDEVLEREGFGDLLQRLG